MNGKLGMRNRIRPLMVLTFVFALSACGIPSAEPDTTDTPATASATPSPAATVPPCVKPTATAGSSSPPEPVAWTSESDTQDWPGPPRIEPSGCAPLLVQTNSPGDFQNHSYDDPAGDVEQALTLIDIVEVEFGADCWFTPSGCVYFDMAADVAEPMPDPAIQWIGYGLVVDTTGDGRPEFRCGIDNASLDVDYGRMWRTDVGTGETYSPIGILEKPAGHGRCLPWRCALLRPGTK
jgi:hypothetical protein